MKKFIQTNLAPKAIGTYSQAVQVGNTVYASGQIPLDPKTMQIVSEDFFEQAEQVFKNLTGIAEAAGGSLQDFVKINVYLTDLNNFAQFNEAMARFFEEPFPARAAIEVSALPRGALIEIEGILEIQ